MSTPGTLFIPFSLIVPLVSHCSLCLPWFSLIIFVSLSFPCSQRRSVIVPFSSLLRPWWCLARRCLSLGIYLWYMRGTMKIPNPLQWLLFSLILLSYDFLFHFIVDLLYFLYLFSNFCYIFSFVFRF